MATGIFIEAIDQSQYKNIFLSQASAERPDIVDEQSIYNQLMTYMEQANSPDDMSTMLSDIKKAVAAQKRSKLGKQVLFSMKKTRSEDVDETTEHNNSMVNSMIERDGSQRKEDTILANYFLQNRALAQRKNVSK